MDLMPALQPRLVYSPHPLLAAAGRQLIDTPFAPGESIAEYLERVGVRIPAHQAVVLAVNGEAIPRDEWALTFPRSGDLITVRTRAQGGDGGSDPLRVILTIAVIIAAVMVPQMIPGIVAGTWQAAAVSAIITVGGMMLVNAIAPLPRPKVRELSGESASPTYALSGGQNRARPWEPLPLVLGTHRIFPDLGAAPFTEFIGDDQYLCQVFNFGLSDVALSDFRIGNTPVESFQGVEIEVSGSDGALALFPGNVDSLAGGELTAAAGPVVRTSSQDTTSLAVDIVGALYRAGDRGIDALEATIMVEYRAVGAGAWTPIAIESDEMPHIYGSGHGLLGMVFTAAREAQLAAEAAAGHIVLRSSSTKPLRRTYRWNVAPGQYEVRVTRVSADETDARNISQLTWAQLRSYQRDAGDYTGQTRVAVRIKASGQLNGALDQFSGVATASAPAWTGSAWVTQPTSNPAWWYLWFARGKTINGRRAYGCLLPDGRIDIEALKAFGAWCDAKGLTVNATLDQQQPCADVLVQIARCGRGAPTWGTGKLGTVWDAPSQPITAMFGMANIRRGTFRVDYITEQVADEIVVRFVNPALDWQYDSVRATVPGVSSPTRPATIDLFGCTDRAMAGREAKLLAANHAYRLRRISWETDIEGFTCNRGDAVGLSHDLTQWGYSGRLVAGTTTTLTLDRTVPFTAGQQHYVGVRFPNGYYTILRVAYSATDTATLTMQDAWPTVDDAGHTLYTASTDPAHPALDFLWFFAPKATPGLRVKIVDVAPVSDTHLRITATDDPDAYYLEEYGAYTYVAPAGIGQSLPTLSNLRISETLIRAGAGYAVQLTLTWDATGSYESAAIRAALGDTPPVEIGRTLSRRFEYIVPDAGTVTLEIVGFDSRARTGAESRIATTYRIQGKSAPPGDVSWFVIDGDVLSWSPVVDADLAGYAIRWQPGSNTSYGDATPLHDGLLTASPYRLVQRPAGPVTLLIKAVDTSGNESLNAARIATDLGDPLVANVVEQIDFAALGWPGTLTGGAIDGSNRLAATSVSAFYGVAAADMYALDSAIFYVSSYSAMSWESAPFTPAEPLAGSRLTLAPTIAGDAWRIEYRPVGPDAFYAASDSEPFYDTDAASVLYDAPPDYVPWPGEIVARHEQYQLRVSTGFGDVQGLVSEFVATIDAPDVAEVLSDVALAPGGMRLPIAKDYALIQRVGVTLQGGTTALGVRVLDKDPVLGPLVQAVDASGSGVAAVIDATIQGY